MLIWDVIRVNSFCDFLETYVTGRESEFDFPGFLIRYVVNFHYLLNLS